jgi:large subunit ribosomal protein L23
VSTDATKREIGRAVEFLFDVQVDSVQVLNVKGKGKRFGARTGRRPDWRKAYVRLKPGQDIDFGGGA